MLAVALTPLSLVMLLNVAVVVITGKADTMLKMSVTVRPSVSLRVTVTVVVPAAVGVPVKMPVVASKLNHAGRVDVVYVAVSPLAVLSTSAKLLRMVNGVMALPTVAVLSGSCTTTVGASLAPWMVTARLAVLLPELSVAV